MKDYYTILGVTRDASQEDIQKAFRKLAHQYHPDKKGGDVNKFKEVNEAYQILSNQQKRAQYDAGFGSGAADGTGSGGFEGFDFSNVDFNFSGGDGFADVINSMFRGAMNRGEDVLIDLTISFEESVFGVVKKITVPYRRRASETVEVRIPAGVVPGTRIQFSGQGEPSKDGHAFSGNLFVRVSVQEHAQFKRQGGDIVCSLPLTPAEAVLGTKKEIQDVRGSALAITVPEMSTEGTAIVFRGRGIPRPAGNDRLIVFCHIMYPKKMNRKVREMFEELRGQGW